MRVKSYGVTHIKTKTVELSTVCYLKSVEKEDVLNNKTNSQPLQLGRGTKRTCSKESKIIKKPTTEAEAHTSAGNSISNDDQVECPTCHIFIKKRYLANHFKSNVHKNNLLNSHNSLSNVSVIESAFGNRILTYKIKSRVDRSTWVNFETPELFLNSIKDDILFLLQECIHQHIIFKVNFILHADFVQQTKDIHDTFDFQTLNYIICQGDDLNIFLSSLNDTITTKISAFEKKDSGWSLKNIKSIDMNVNKFNPLRGTSYIDLPRDIKLKKAVINVKNKDYFCFKWALLSALYPVNKHTDRVSSYVKHANKLKFDGISFPVKISDIAKVEKLNDISINVFGLEYNKEKRCNSIVGPLFLTKCRKDRHINLLFFSKDTKNHYCYIKNLSRLVSKQISKDGHIMYICEACLLRFPSQERLNNHEQYDCAHICTVLPNSETLKKKNWFGQPISNDKIKFDSYEKKLKIPFVVYADFEAFLKPIESCSNDPSKPFTHNIQKHEVHSFGYYIKCSYDDKLSKYVTYCGPNCAQVFMESLSNNLKEINRLQKYPPLPLTNEDKNQISNATICHICETELAKHFYDFDWYTGNFIGVAHESCCSKIRTPSYIPIFLHNLSHYDAHFIVHALNFCDGEVEVIPQNKEKYISFSKKLKVNNHEIILRFLDSFKFLSCKLEELAKNLSNDQFQELRRNYPNDEDFFRLKRKGVYPYELMTNYDSLSLTSLPEQKCFYSSLTDSHISNDDYNHAKDVWEHFGCCNMLDYSNLYLKTDVLLLSDVFENFRKLCINTYDLDPVHYYTAPGLSWDAMLKYTKIELELLTDYEKIAFIRSGIRGGVSQCSNRYARANNKYMEDYDTGKPNSYITYFDANNLYGWAMSQYLPTGGFEWVNPNTEFNVSRTSDFGFILEVDLEYPDELHDLHSDFPLCPENICVGNINENKLVPNLNNKDKYVIHYRNLKQCIEMGVKLTKIHRVLKFKQSPWLKMYIDLNTKLRTLAKSDFEKDFYKLMNNSVFGKTMENIEKRVNIKLVTHWENQGKALGAQDLIAKPQFHSLSIFSENLVAVQLRKTKLIYNKPIYLGFCILDISKTLMYDFHYNYMIKKFSKIKLLYTDTDSLIYHIFTNDFYTDIKPDLSSYFDTSDYDTNNIFEYPKLNKKKLGFFKDENNGKIMKEFVGLRSKMYAFNLENKTIAKAKGVNKCITKKMTMNSYKSSLFNKKVQYYSMLRFKSIKHTIFTQKLNKIGLSYNDTKRHILDNNIETLAWGHYKLR
ncbi:unnamed protein product [Parnassius mnemosyne]|uniref:DNA-directed DNA polymerase n=1 Tax=Parnassius mnemosyne TaxID=213953 RepID=A0AAV1LRM6_9NEOP